MKPNLDEVFGESIVNGFLILFWGSLLVLSALAYAEYPGQGYIYIFFTLVSSLLLYFGFRKNAIFFDTFLGIFFWLGFWLKLTFKVAFTDGAFHEAVGYFDGSGAAFDRALLVTSFAMSGFLLASFLRERFFFNYPRKLEGVTQQGFFNFYVKHRRLIWAGFATLIISVGVTNAYLGIYQRGSITRTVLPFGLNGIYKWLLLFGLASISAIIIRFEFEVKKKTVLLIMLLGFFETLVSNVSLLSRAMVLNGTSLLYGVSAALKPYSIKSSIRFFLAAGLIFSVLFIGSVLTVNYLRSLTYWDHLQTETVDMKVSSIAAKFRNEARRMKAHAGITQQMTAPLFIDRWVGMEGVLAISSQPNLGWDLWKAAWQEDYDEKAFSFYDSVIESHYLDIDATKHHFISLPGVIAFFFYPGSFNFLFASMLTLGLAAAAIEVFVFRLGGKNLILCALIAQVVAFRFASFGYVPKQSYLLFGTIILNILIIYFADKLLTRFQTKSASALPINS